MTLPTSIVPGPNVRISHHRIHEGNFFSTHTVSTGLLVANPKRFLFNSGPTLPIPEEQAEIHIIFVISANPGVEIGFFEDAVVTNNGATIPIINQNRNSTTSPVGSVFENPMVISDGTLIFSQIIGSTTIGGTGGLLSRDEQEFILKVNTLYILKITPLIDGVDITTHFKGYDARPSSPVIIP